MRHTGSSPVLGTTLDTRTVFLFPHHHCSEPGIEQVQCVGSRNRIATKGCAFCSACAVRVQYWVPLFPLSLGLFRISSYQNYPRVLMWPPGHTPGLREFCHADIRKIHGAKRKKTLLASRLVFSFLHPINFVLESSFSLPAKLRFCGNVG